MTSSTTLRMDATFLGLRDIGPWLDEFYALQPSPLDESKTGAIELAVHELAANAVDHACPADGIVTLEAMVTGSELVVRMTDIGAAFTGAVEPDPDEPQVRGYGLMIIEQVAEELDYERAPDRNIWTARFAIETNEQLNPTSRQVEQQS